MEDTQAEAVLDPAIEVDEQLPFDPGAIPEELLENEEFMAAARKAQSGQYDHTFFEIFEDQLESSLAATQGDLTIEVADSILKAWPWIRYVDLELYLGYRSRMLSEAIIALQENFPKPRELLFLENAKDWESHRDAYIEIMVAWSVLNNKWYQEWKTLKFNDRKKAILHCVIADLTYIILGPDGMVEKFRYLADFEITPEEAEDIQARIKELSDE